MLKVRNASLKHKGETCIGDIIIILKMELKSIIIDEIPRGG